MGYTNEKQTSIASAKIAISSYYARRLGTEECLRTKKDRKGGFTTYQIAKTLGGPHTPLPHSLPGSRLD